MGLDSYLSEKTLSKLVRAYCDCTAWCNLQESYPITLVKTRDPLCSDLS